MVSGVYPPFTSTRTSCTPATVGANACDPLENRKYHSTQTMAARPTAVTRSEEHTSELQSRLHLVCRLLLEKKKATPARPAPRVRPVPPARPEPRARPVPP